MPKLPEMIEIPAGPVVLGEPAFPPGNKLPHPWKVREVYVPKFAIAKYAVTVEAYKEFTEKTGYPLIEELKTDPRFQDPQAPVAYTSWIDATRYAQWLARETGKPFRLIRDAEYEKAAL